MDIWHATLQQDVEGGEIRTVTLLNNVTELVTLHCWRVTKSNKQTTHHWLKDFTFDLYNDLQSVINSDV